tara:strand:+ start:7900 stop:8148 length:249 start_codon:yes stop_codon:yes gene_type:complete
MPAISHAELKHMTMAYAIGMWHKRAEHDIYTPVEIHINHVRNRLPTRVWGKRIEAAFTELVETHPHYSRNSVGVLEYFPGRK